jgi:death-on-curing protein
VNEYLKMAGCTPDRLIAEAVLGIPAESLAKTERIGLLESAVLAPAASFEGTEFHPNLAVKAAVLAGHIAKNHPLPDGNKRVAFLAMVELLERNGYEWTPPPGDEDGEITDRVIRAVAASDLSEETIAELTDWIKSCTGL